MANEIKSRCPRCRKLLNSMAELIGETGTCPQCKADFIIEEFKAYGGIGRPAYFFGIIGAGLLSTVPFGFIVAIALAGILVLYRLKNIGRNEAWAMLIIIPIANLFVTIPCLILPEGYDDTKKLDTAAKIIVGILIAMVVLTITIAVLASLE